MGEDGNEINKLPKKYKYSEDVLAGLPPMERTGLSDMELAELNRNKNIHYDAGVGKYWFYTRKHQPFEIMCGNCNHLGLTKTREATRKSMFPFCLLDCWQICIARCAHPYTLHRTHHFC